MRTLAFVAAACLLSLVATPASAATEAPAEAPYCPYITSLATVCVGGSLDCFVSIRVMGGDRLCLP